ncbi:unnamed protein product [Closterium sp. NIES-53]
MASYRSTGTYVDEVPLAGANVVDGMWIFKVKRPPESPPIFKARYVARGFSQREGVDYFQTFAPTPKMTTLRVSGCVVPLPFTGTFPPGTQWRLRHPVYGLRQAPREWHDTLRSTLSDLGFQPSSADPSLFVRRGSTPFFVLVYVDDLVFATTDTVALADVKLTGPFPNEPFEPCGPYPELVGCLMYLMTCTRPDLAFPRSILAHFVAPRRHRLVHRTAVVRVAKYLATTSGVGLVLGRRQPVMLTGHCETSYADDVETHRSTQGYSFSLGSGAVSWRSNRSSSVSTSTAEAEIYAGVVAA